MGKCYFNREWLKDDRFVEWLGQVVDSPDFFFCRVCKRKLSIGKNGIKALHSHMKASTHVSALLAAKQSPAIFGFMKSKGTSVPGHSESPSGSSAINVSPATTSITVTTTTSNSVCDTSVPVRKLDAYISNEKTLSAEVRWVLHLVCSHSSARSSDDVSKLFCAMFSDSAIAKNFQCGRTKAGYIAAYGLAPAIKQLITEQVKGAEFFTLMFDESFNSELQLKQMDIHVRFVCEDLVETKYYTSFFMGHAKAIDIQARIMDAVSSVGNNNLLQISMDGPNVNLKVFKDMSAALEHDKLKLLINIGTCGLHVLHNAFKDGIKATEWDICNLLKAAHYLFQESPARREDFFQTTKSNLLPLQYCGHRWLENLDAAKRLLDILPSLKEYVTACKNGKTAEPMCKSFKSVVEFLADKLLIVKLHCFVHISTILQPFLQKYQSNEPLTPFLASDLFEIIKRLFSLILKDDYLQDLSLESKLDPEKIGKEHLKPQSKIQLGCLADQELSKLIKSKTVSDRESMGVHLDFQKLCCKIISKIVSKGPIAYNFARDITCLNPDNFRNERSSEMFQKVVTYLHTRRWLSAEEVDESVYSYQALKESSMNMNYVETTRLDKFYKQLPNLQPSLRKVINIVLTLSHGNAEVERGFSVNKEVSTDNMAGNTLIAKRLICQFVKDNGCPATVPLTKAMLSSCSGAYQKYKMALEEQKRASEKMSAKDGKRKKAEQLKELNVKRRKMELDVELLTTKADDLAEQAEDKTSYTNTHELLVQSNALRKEAKVKKADIAPLTLAIKALEEELASSM